MRTSIMGALVLTALACSSEEDGGGGGVVGRRDAAVQNRPDAAVQPLERIFEVDVVEGLGTDAVIGDGATAALTPEGRPAVAYRYFLPGPGDTPDTGEIRYAEFDGVDWNVETVANPSADQPGTEGQFYDLGFAFVGEQATIAFAGGPQASLEPILGDLIVATRTGGGWNEATLVTDSAGAQGLCEANNGTYCDNGAIVGLKANIAVGPGGSFAITYRDNHFGFGSEDNRQADLEVVVQPAGERLMIDGGRSAGQESASVFLSDGTIAVAYSLDVPVSEDEERFGVWFAIQDGEGGWLRTQLWSGQPSHRLSIGADSSDNLYVAFWDPDAIDLVVASSTDLGANWKLDEVEQRGDVGLHPSLIVDDDDVVHVAYTYCGEASDRECPGKLGRDSEVRLATLSGGQWFTQTVDDGQGQGFVGTETSLVALPDGKLGVAFVDQRNGDLLFAREVDQ